MKEWIKQEEDVYLWPDSCNVYAVRGTADDWLIINAGTGVAASQLARLGVVRVRHLLLTHFFRDHAAGTELFRQNGTVVRAPYWERDHLAGEQPACRTKPTEMLYDLMWDHFAPITPLSVDLWLMDYARHHVAGLDIEVVPTPGVTLGAVSYVVTLRSGRRVAFIGELMAGPGKVARLSPLQYNYNDLLGGENLLLSWERLLALGPVAAYPSLGAPFAALPAAVAALRENLRKLDQVQPGMAERLARNGRTEIEEVCPGLWRAQNANAETHFVVGRTGRVLALDYGYNTAGICFPNRTLHCTRRPLLHSLEALREKTGATRIDVVIATHYHDDHVAGIGLLQRLFGTELWAGENFADLLEQPRDFDRPCLWPEPMRVSRRLPLGATFEWDGVPITLHPMTGHTEFSTLICLELNGRRIAHTGDQIFFLDAAGVALVPPESARGLFTNHVYRNGLALGGYVDCLRHLRAFAPDWILSGHAKPYRPTEAAWRMIESGARGFDDAHRSLMALETEDVHFGADSTGAKLHPYSRRLSLLPATVPMQGWVLNPFGQAAEAELRLVLPSENWSATSTRIMLEPRSRRTFTLKLSVPPGAASGRHMIALELSVAGRRFGQVAEAWVTIG
ncbi:MAG: MBL fold metallo-hydrolase [Opitutae bacterium]|nr:MBL fold metallo-hydrolase [Opitutae bacterium]